MAKKIVKVNVKAPKALSASAKGVPVKVKTGLNGKLVNSHRGKKP